MSLNNVIAFALLLKKVFFLKYNRFPPIFSNKNCRLPEKVQWGKRIFNNECEKITQQLPMLNQKLKQ